MLLERTDYKAADDIFEALSMRPWTPGLRRFAAIVFASMLCRGMAEGAELTLFSERASTEANISAIVDRFDQWTREYGRDSCRFERYEGIATPAFFLQWFLGSVLESTLRYALCSDDGNDASHVLIDIKSRTRSKQRFTIGMKSVAEKGRRRPHYSEMSYASRASFIEYVERSDDASTSYDVHHRYRGKPAERESGLIKHPAGITGGVQTYASLMTYVSELVAPGNASKFLLTDPYSAAIQDRVIQYPMWRNEPFQVISATIRTDQSIAMKGWFPYAFGQLNADVTLCLGEGRLPDLLTYRHPFMDVDLWRTSETTENYCKQRLDEARDEKRRSEPMNK